MSEEKFVRTELLIGENGIKRLQNARVAVFGIGGVGGYTVEALVRSGVGSIDIIDNDVVSVSNINRQIIATVNTVGKSKVDVMEERVLSINPDCKVSKFQKFFLSENADEFDFLKYDYIVDAVDTVSAKIAIIERAKRYGVKVISCMGAGNKLNATDFKVSDIYKTSVCPLARVMRKELKTRGIKSLKVVYSEEQPCEKRTDKECDEGGKKNTGSISFVPSVAGLIIAGEVIKDLIYDK